MTITINGDNVNYTLEDEKTAGEVLAGLSSWLEDSGLLVGGIMLDDESVPLGEIEWRERPVDGIQNLSIEAVSIRAGRVMQLETARDYFILLKDAVESGNEEDIRELSESFEDLRSILPHLLDEGPNPTIVPHLEESMAKLDKRENLAFLVNETTQLAMLLEGRRREAANPEGEAKSAALALAAMAGSLDDVAVHLQTGKDKQAMETIIGLTELLQTFMRSLSWIGADNDVESITDDMNAILAELEEALKASDTVLIGDLLEYEIKPRLLDLPDALSFTGEAST